MKIAIVDYRAGNLTSVRQAFARIGADAVITSSPEIVSASDRIVVPGVGHFSRTSSLAESGLQSAIQEAVERSVPLLGICLGMQWLFTASREAPGVPGLGLLSGECEHFPSTVKSPHVGWNQLELRFSSDLLRGLPDRSFMYFTHSYRAPVTPQTCAISEYGGAFSAAVQCGHVFGVQFHPEKSGSAGLQILANFCALPC
jgi:glutamine amidotransferase